MTANQPSRPQRVILPVLVAVGALVLAIVMATGGKDGGDQKVSSDAKTTAANSGSAATSPGDTTSANDPTSLGSANAPVVMVAYSEFQCPYCGRFAKESLPTLIERYVDPGVLRIEWRDLPYLGDESFRASFGARAAAEQDAFWAFHDVLFAEQSPKPNSGHITDEYLVGVATEIGLDVEQFEVDYRSDAVNDAVRNDRDSGVRAGVNGTPAFFVNGTPIVGAQPVEVFVEVIEAAAAPQ
ncbi:MAG: DsbA family protein [Aquihabitans sp.]